MPCDDGPVRLEPLDLQLLPVPVTMASLGEATTVTYTVTIEKRRRGGGRWFDTENHTDSGAGSPGRLITLALEATQHAGALGAVIAPVPTF